MPNLAGRLPWLAVAVAAAHPLDERRHRSFFGDQQVGVEIETHFADLRRHRQHCALRFRMKGFDHGIVLLFTISQSKAAVIAEDRYSVGRFQLGIIERHRKPLHNRLRPGDRIHHPQHFFAAASASSASAAASSFAAVADGIARSMGNRLQIFRLLTVAVDLEAAALEFLLATLGQRRRHAQYGNGGKLRQKILERREHAPVEAMHFVHHHHRISQHRQQANAFVTVLQKGKELIDRRREDLLLPAADGKQPRIGAVPFAGQAVIRIGGELFQFIRRGTVHQRCLVLRCPGNIVLEAFGGRGPRWIQKQQMLHTVDRLPGNPPPGGHCLAAAARGQQQRPRRQCGGVVLELIPIPPIVPQLPDARLDDVGIDIRCVERLDGPRRDFAPNRLGSLLPARCRSRRHRATIKPARTAHNSRRRAPFFRKDE